MLGQLWRLITQWHAKPLFNLKGMNEQLAKTIPKISESVVAREDLKSDFPLPLISSYTYGMT